MLSQQKNTEKLRNVFKLRLRSVMQRRGIQSNELAEKLGVSEGAVSNWMNGRNFAKGKNLRDLADFTGRPMEWFFEDPSVSYEFDPARSAAIETRDEPAPAVSRENCIGHLEKFLDTCENDAARMGWTSVVLRETFPLDKWKTSSKIDRLAKYGGSKALAAVKDSPSSGLSHKAASTTEKTVLPKEPAPPLSGSPQSPPDPAQE